ncbi:MAG TPA: hypothetical protein VK705_03870 [Ferruginibacter sp.]|jgi:hypothetical protein|nr:hypothetical protein [Ferruginibacter sp.]
MKHILTAVIVFLSFCSYGQKIAILKSYKLDSSYSLVGLNPGYEKGTLYKNFCFIIDQPSDLLKTQKEWVFEKKLNGVFDMNGFSIYLVKNKSIVNTWVVSPSYNDIATNASSFVFDTTILTDLAMSSPLLYRSRIDTFRSIDDFKAFKMRSKLDSSFIFLFKPDIDYEGSFQVKIKKTTQINSPKKATEKLDKLLNAIDKNGYDISYELSAENINDPSQITLTIESKKYLYDNFSDQNFIKGSWVPTSIVVTSIWKAQ